MSRAFKCILANGCWDMLHYGHLIHLEQARSMGHYLVVSVTDDRHVNKGPGRPVYPEDQRAALVDALKCVSETIIVPSLLAALDLVQPDILVKGIDYLKGLDKRHRDYCKRHAIEIRFTDTPKYSASDFIAARHAKHNQGL